MRMVRFDRGRKVCREARLSTSLTIITRKLKRSVPSRSEHSRELCVKQTPLSEEGFV